jgi:hypothetical protein
MDPGEDRNDLLLLSVQPTQAFFRLAIVNEMREAAEAGPWLGRGPDEPCAPVEIEQDGYHRPCWKSCE